VSAEYGTWEVNECEDGECVIVTIDHMGLEGVEHFETSMLAANALEFGKSIVEVANRLGAS
jgi:hypothetical protein